jgi:hypothetical protein
LPEDERKRGKIRAEALRVRALKLFCMFVKPHSMHSTRDEPYCN